MLEIIEKIYPNTTTAEELDKDIMPLWDWYKVEKSETSIKYYVHETAYLELVKAEGFAPYFKLSFNGTSQTITNTGGQVKSYSLHLHIAKTNYGVIIQSSCSTSIAFNVPVTITPLIIANATDHYAGKIVPVLACMQSVSANYDGASFQNGCIVCSPDVETGMNFTEPWYTKYLGNKMVFAPFFDGLSRCTLNDVYYCICRQWSSLYRGECMLSGRQAYMNGWIMIPCE